MTGPTPVWIASSWIAVGATASVGVRMRRGPRVGQDRLSDSTVAKLIKQCARDAGHENVSMFAGHSLRRGFITTAARNRADVFAIAAQSLHRSLDTVREYVDAVPRFDHHPGLKMFQ